jgi:monofunctional biosynthetic peptidoglycan transglycosylase
MARRITLLVLAAAFAWGLYVLAGLPARAEVRALARRNPDKTGVMRQREDEAKRAKRKPRRVQTWVPLSRVSRNLVHAVVVAEDPKFFGHEGVDWDAIKESLEKDIKERRFARGGSTITMQVVKNLFLWPSKSYVRKAIEIPLTYVVEAAWSKRRILEIYLNIAEWGPGVFGAEAAARFHFRKAASQLSPREAALLAVSLPNPFERQAGSPGPGTSRLADNLLARMRTAQANAFCVRGR